MKWIKLGPRQQHTASRPKMEWSALIQAMDHSGFSSSSPSIVSQVKASKSWHLVEDIGCVWFMSCVVNSWNPIDVEMSIDVHNFLCSYSDPERPITSTFSCKLLRSVRGTQWLKPMALLDRLLRSGQNDSWYISWYISWYCYVPLKRYCLICPIGEMSHLVKDTETSCWWWPLLDGFVQDVVTWHHDAHVDHLEKR